MADMGAAHGKEERRWCDQCGTLLLGNMCSLCGSRGRKFELNSPGDIRPCFGEGREIILRLIKDTFGTAEPFEGKALFLNKVPGEDRTDELIAHGVVVGIVRFDIVLDRLVFEPRQPGVDLLRDIATKNVVWFWGMPGHLKGKSVPGTNINEARGDFREGEPVIVRKGQKAGPGIALSDSSVMKESEKAIRIRDLNALTERPLSRDSDRDQFVKSNVGHLKVIESRAIIGIREFLSERDLPVTVSFSGGKDSLAAYGIASKAVKDLSLIFVDTGLEYPETLEYVRRFSKDRNLKLIEASAGDAFWDNVDTFGPPAKDFRWCCKVCKLGPITDLIADNFPEGTVTIEGNRMLESFARSKIGFVSRNPFVPSQINLNPVRTWNAAEIWCYIWMRRLEYNPLYDRDFERIGCYLCASCLASEWRNTGRIHPDMYSRWEEYLKGYAERRGLPPEYVTMGFWRWKVLPPKMVQLAEGLELKMEPSVKNDVSMNMLKGASPCTSGGFSMEAVVNVPRNRDFSYVEDALRTVGETKYSSEFEIALLRMGKGRARLFGGGQVSVTAGSQDEAEMIFERAVKALLRAELCTSCGICARGCPKHAITIDGGMRVDPELCITCGKCEESCMVVHYYDKIMKGISGTVGGSCSKNRKD